MGRWIVSDLDNIDDSTDKKFKPKNFHSASTVQHIFSMHERTFHFRSINQRLWLYFHMIFLLVQMGFGKKFALFLLFVGLLGLKPFHMRVFGNLSTFLTQISGIRDSHKSAIFVSFWVLWFFPVFSLISDYHFNPLFRLIKFHRFIFHEKSINPTNLYRA